MPLKSLATLFLLATLPITPEAFSISGPNAGQPLPPPKPVSMTRPATADTTAEKCEDRGTPERANRWVTSVTQSTLTLYPVDSKSPTPFVVICPGGGYAGLAIDKEGHDIARYLNTLGLSAGVLKYRMPTTRPSADAIPFPQQDARDALALVRSKAKDWNIDPTKIGIFGFSAGGHLASSLAVHNFGPVNDIDSRPNFAILAYPVISTDPAIYHKGSITNLLGKEPTQADLTLYSSDKKVSEKTPPIFIFHAADDRAVPIANSERFVEACKKSNVPVEFHTYPKGGHGFGFGTPGTDSVQWPTQLATWLKSQGLAPQ